MKTGKYFRVCLFLITVLSFLTVSGFSQDESKPTRKEIKEARKLQLSQNYAILDTLLTRRIFVLEADYLRDKYGNQEPVASQINFIKFDQTRGIIQTGANSGWGTNGVGGTTAEGEIKSWEISKNPKNLSYTVRAGLMTNLGQFDILILISANNHGSATLTSSYPGSLIWVGRVVPLEHARVFKGQNAI